MQALGQPLKQFRMFTSTPAPHRFPNLSSIQEPLRSLCEMKIQSPLFHNYHKDQDGDGSIKPDVQPS